MYAITAKLKGISKEPFDTIEGNYKNKKVADRHKRELEKKYPGTTFKIEQIAKKNKSNFYTYYAVKGHIERGEL